MACGACLVVLVFYFYFYVALLVPSYFSLQAHKNIHTRSERSIIHLSLVVKSIRFNGVSSFVESLSLLRWKEV